MMEIGLGRLRLSPQEFWSATPREIAAAFPTNEAPAMDRPALDRLMQLFPDDP